MAEPRHYHYAIARRADLHGQADGFDARPIAPIDGADRGLFSVDIGELALIVSETTDDDILATRRNMLAHTRALEEIMGRGPILPFRFGIVAAPGEGAARAIASRESDLSRQLKALEGRYEMGVRITWNEKAAMNAVVADEPSLRAAYERLQGRSETETHYERIELGRRVHDALSLRRASDADRFERELAGKALDWRRHETNDDFTVLSAACLVDAEAERAVSGALDALDAAASDVYAIKVVAPAPPFNFVDIDLGAPSAAAA
ncbi:MAG: GvpL/GvpF family gas vesicle protein [Parvularculaceae bacterium]